MVNDSHRHLRRAAQLWALPALCTLLAVFVWLGPGNIRTFLVVNAWGSAPATWLWSNLTLLGDGLVLLTLAAPFLRQRPDIVWALLLAALWGSLVTHGLKPLFGLPRPAAVLAGEQIHIIGQPLYRGSFPSGHTLAVFTYAAVLVRGIDRPSLTLLVLGGAILVGLSRMVVGAHWPVDVLAGAGLGWLCGQAGWYFAQRWEKIPRQGGWYVMAALIGVGALWLLVGHRSGYPAADILQRAIGLITLLLVGWAVWRQLQRARVAPPDAP